jgi:hypothetical protein
MTAVLRTSQNRSSGPSYRVVQRSCDPPRGVGVRPADGRGRSRSNAAGETRGPALPRNLATTSATSSATRARRALRRPAHPRWRHQLHQRLTPPQPRSIPDVRSRCRAAAGVDSGSYVVTVLVDAAPDCRWKATSSAPWLTIVRGEEGAGRGRVELLVATKRAAGSRAAQVQFGMSASFTVSQSGGAAATSFAGAAWDIDRDGRTDLAVWRPSTGDWYIRPSGAPGVPFVRNWPRHRQRRRQIERAPGADRSRSASPRQ